MTSFSPKIEIINHFDNLINKVDIDIDDSHQKYSDKQIIGELLNSSTDERKNFRNKNKEKYFYVEFSNTIDSSKNNIWTESTKVIDYLNQVRMQTIDELRKAQDDCLEHYKLNSSHFKNQLTEKISIDELKSELFAEKFYFQVSLTQTAKRLWYFNLFTFATDFYIPPSYVDLLEKLINAEEPFCRASSPVFDQNMVLLCLLYQSFIENLSNFPSHIIRVNKQDVLNIKSIHFEYDYSGIKLANSSTINLSRLVKLELNIKRELAILRESAEIKIEGLSSLETLDVAINAREPNFSIRNLPSLKKFYLSIPRINEKILIPLLDQMQYIEELGFAGHLYYFNVDNLVNLKRFCLSGLISDEFNFDIFKNISKQLEDLAFF